MKFWTKLRSLFRKEKFDAEMAEEMRLHLEMQTERNLAAGMDAKEARYAALRQFGGVEQIKEFARDQRGWVWLEQFLQDLRYGFHSLRRSRGFAVAVILTLGLGVGANTAIFSVVNSVLLKPLPYQEPERLVTLLHDGRHPVAPADFLDWRSQSRSFAKMAAAESWGGTLTGGERPEIIEGIRFGDGMFEVLGVKPILGRTFQVDDFRGGGSRVLVLSHSLWQRRFASDRDVVGRTVLLSGATYVVIGVMPPGFRFAPFWATAAEMASPLDLTDRATSRGANSLRVFARLGSGVSQDQAQAEMDTLCRQLELAYPQTNTGRTVRVDTLMDKTVGAIRSSLYALASAVGLVLVIACVNVANLLLARSTARQKEIAVRTALGATSGRIIRQLLTESCLLATAGGALGLLLGYFGVGAIKAMLAENVVPNRLSMPRMAELAVDGNVLLFTIAVVMAAGILFGLAPALQTARLAQQDALQENTRGATGGQRALRLRHVLVIMETALALITLIGAGLLLRSFDRLAKVDPGFDARDGIAMIVSLYGQPEMVGERREAFYQDTLERISALPGVVSASAVNHFPLIGDFWGQSVRIEGRTEARPGEGIVAGYRVVRPGYFKTMGTAMRGRDFQPQDASNAPGVAIINEQFARTHWQGEDPLGKRVTLDDETSNPRWLTIVGVVENIKQTSWTENTGNEIYLPFQQSPFFFETARHFAAMTLVVRTAIAATAQSGPIQETVWKVNADAPISSVATFEQVVAGAVWQQRFNLILIGLFAGVALLLTAIGLYGVIAYSVVQRTREFGVRMALGASRRDVLSLTLKQGLRLAGMGLATGLAGAWVVTRLLASLLYKVEPHDPWTFVGVTAMLLVVALFACWLPARRASKVDPIVALRSE